MTDSTHTPVQAREGDTGKVHGPVRAPRYTVASAHDGLPLHAGLDAVDLLAEFALIWRELPLSVRALKVGDSCCPVGARGMVVRRVS